MIRLLIGPDWVLIYYNLNKLLLPCVNNIVEFLTPKYTHTLRVHTNTYANNNYIWIVTYTKECLFLFCYINHFHKLYKYI